MSEFNDLAAFFEALDPHERAELERAVAADPALGRALNEWRALRSRVGGELDARLPAAGIVALAVGRADPSLLDESDRVGLAAAQARLGDEEVRGVLEPAVDRLEDDARAFLSVWDEHVERSAAADQSLRTMNRVMGVGRAVDRPTVRRAQVTPLWSRVGRIAAVFALISLGALASYLWRRDAGLERIVAADEMTIDLPDGSSVQLAAASELLVPEGPPRDPDAISGAPVEGAPRFARLVAGRALFRVARSDEPFVVETPAADVTVLGTTFGVTASSRQTDVVLVSGLVEVASRGDGAAVRLEPGQRTNVRAGHAPAAAEPTDINAVLAWTGDLFIRSESLVAAAQRIGTAFGVTVTVDSTLGTEAVTGRFDRASGPRAALAALAMAVNGRLVEDAGSFRIERASD